MYPSFTIFGKTFGTYSICAIIGLVVCGLVISAVARKRKVSWLDVLLAIIAIGIGMTVGGHFLYGITKYQVFIEAVSEIGTISFMDFFNKMIETFGGSVFYGGLIGGFFGLEVLMKIEKELERKYFWDLYGMAIPLFHTFGRIGCFFGGCCYGVESSFGFIVEQNEYSPGLAGPRRFPVQLLEALLNLILFFVLFLIYRSRYKNAEAPKKMGSILFLYLLIYPVYRFILEFFRGDEIRGHWFGLSTSQWISIVLFIIGIIGTVIYNLPHRKEDIQD